MASRRSPGGLRAPADVLARWIATCGGLGYLPVSGTLTSLPVALAAWLLAPTDQALLGASLGAAIVGAWAAGREEARLGLRDPASIVVDEVAGMLLALAWAPRTLAWTLGLFCLFRILDVWKPLGIDRLQALPGGLGVVSDDLLAGAYTALAGQLRHLS
jgi:phosphatidylglycerophosphatase A